MTFNGTSLFYLKREIPLMLLTSKLSRTCSLILALVLALIVTHTSLVAATIYVPDDYPTIQEAVDAASPGETIIVRDGTYLENLKVSTDHLTIRSENGAETTIVQAANPNSDIFSITSNNVILKGITIRGATLIGSGIWPAGIHLDHVYDCTVSDNVVEANSSGIHLEFSSRNTLSYNVVRDNSTGVDIGCSPDNVLMGNNLLSNDRNFDIRGLQLSDFLQDIDISNTVNGKPIHYIIGAQGLEIDSSWSIGYLAVVNCSDIMIHDLVFTNNGQGILLAGTERTKIENNTLTENSEGIALYYCTDNTLIKNVAYNNGEGMWFYRSSKNEVYANDLINNVDVFQISSKESSNMFYSSMPITYSYNGANYTNHLGNHWSHYSGVDVDNNGIGDTPCCINSDQDNYPLMDLFENYVIDGAQDHVVTIPDIPSGPSSGKVGESLAFAVAGATCNQGHPVQYRFDWGDDSGYSNWGVSTSVSHTYGNAGTYQVKAQARCVNNTSVVSDWSSYSEITIEEVLLPDMGFWAEVVNAPYGIRLKPSRSPESEFKLVPNGWILWVVDTHGNRVVDTHGNREDEDGPHIWWEVKDVTDPECSDCGPYWMAAKSINSGTNYLVEQSGLSVRVSRESVDTVEERRQVVLDSVTTFYKANSGSSLYDANASIRYLVENGFPAELVLAVVAQESTPDLDNEFVSYDCGRGIMQITTNALVGVGSLVSCSCQRFQHVVTSATDGCFGSCCYDSNRLKSSYCSKCDAPGTATDCGVQFCITRDLQWKCYCIYAPHCSCYPYSNTIQGIFANIKDGMTVLSDKYIASRKANTENFAQWAGALLRYNGGVEYLEKVASRLEDLDHYFPQYRMALEMEGISLLDRRLRQDFVKFLRDYTRLTLGSPAELRVLDSNGHVTGLVNGQILREVPSVDFFDDALTIYGSVEGYRFLVEGADDGVYCLSIDWVTDEVVSFDAFNMPIKKNEAHEYTVDWQVLTGGGPGVMLAVDHDGDGVFEESFELGIVHDGGQAPDYSQAQVTITCGPNPVRNTGVAFFYNLPEGSEDVELLIFAVSGCLVTRLPLDSNGVRFPVSGFWEPVDQKGRPLANAPYVYVLAVDGKPVSQGKMVIRR